MSDKVVLTEDQAKTALAAIEFVMSEFNITEEDGDGYVNTAVAIAQQLGREVYIGH